MRIGHVISSLDRRTGGVATAVIGLAASQARAGMTVRVLTSFGANEECEPAIAELKAAGVDTHCVGPVYGRLMGWHPRNTAAADELINQVDLLHVHAVWEDIQHQAMRRARKRRMPYVVSPHGMLATWSLQQRSLKKSIYLALRLRKNLNAATAIHFTTAEEARQAKPLGLRPREIVEPLGLDLAEFADLPPVGTFHDRYPQLANRPLVLFMSRLHEKKGLDLLVPAFAKAASPDAMLVIAGPDDNGYAAEIRKMVEANALSDRVLFTGMLRGRERVAALADADLFVLPSYQENFGLVVPEALAAGTPVVVSDQVNFSEHLTGSPFARIVPCQVEPLAAALRESLGDTLHRQELGLAARDWVRQRFDANAIAQHWTGHYASLLSR